MIGQPFINPVISNAIELYLKYKDHSDDPVFKTFSIIVFIILLRRVLYETLFFLFFSERM